MEARQWFERARRTSPTDLEAARHLNNYWLGGGRSDLVSPPWNFAGFHQRIPSPTMELKGCQWPGAVFRDAQFSADMSGCDLSGADFRGANFSGTFAAARLEGADFRGAKVAWEFAGAQLGGARFDGASLYRVDFTGADLTGASFEGTDLSSARFDASRLHGTSFVGAEAGHGPWISRPTFVGARYNCLTRWPAWLDIKVEGAVEDACPSETAR